jgi:hypothetical protein
MMLREFSVVQHNSPSKLSTIAEVQNLSDLGGLLGLFEIVRRCAANTGTKWLAVNRCYLVLGICV